ncbi:uncharacterized protein LOC143027953 isoform X2 [Oratosquilla oratoria]
MKTCMKLMLLVVVVVLATLVSHVTRVESRTPIPPAFCKFYCSVGDSFECCDNGYPIDGRCQDPDIVYVNVIKCPPGRTCPAIFGYKKCGTITERCRGNEFCCPVDTEEADFACAFLRDDRVPNLPNH